jgi:hypothetical protein
MDIFENLTKEEKIILEKFKFNSEIITTGNMNTTDYYHLESLQLIDGVLIKGTTDTITWTLTALGADYISRI